MKILEVKNLTKKYNDNEVLKNVSFEVEEGKTLVILGASGSGKSTLLRCINNLEKVTSGNIIINGKEMIKEYKNNIPIYNSKEVLKKINLETGMIFQDFNLFPHLSVKKNITEALICVLKKNSEEAEIIAEDLLLQMNLLNKKDSYPCNLSGGQKQRVSIARCLALNPKIICMDEPTSALDPELVGEVLKVIKKLAKEKRTMIIVTHEIKFAEEVADKIIFMDSGKIVEQGTPEEVIRNPKKSRTKQFLKRYINFDNKIDSKSDEKFSEENLKNIEPKEVINFFQEISNIPRKSGKEEKIRDYLVEFAKKRNLEYYTDQYFNVIIRKNGDNEEKEFLGLQAHIDMICEKNDKVKHDFSKDPIKLIKEGDFIRADGTTLGADNGIGMAIILAILSSPKFEKCNLEAIFTVQEETTMIGAKQINIEEIKSKKIISLDNSKEGKMVISSANCMEWFGEINKNYIENIYENSYELEYSDFRGGHSGNDIQDKTRLNPIKLGINLLSNFENINIGKLEGGSRVNVIPRNFKIEFASKEDIYNELIEKIEVQKENIKKYGKITIRKISKKDKVFSKETTKQIMNFISTYQNGAIKFLDGNVVLSANLGAIRDEEEKIKIEYSLRSNNKKMKEEYLNNLEKIQEENKINIIWQQELDGFEPDYNSGLVVKVSEIYKKIFSKDIEKVIVQGVLEGGILKNRINGLEYICIGLNIYDAHSPKERFSINSLKRTWKLVEEIVSKI